MFLCPCFSTSYHDSLANLPSPFPKQKVCFWIATHMCIPQRPKNDVIYQEPSCSSCSSQECMLSLQKHKAVEKNRNQPHCRRCCVSYWHCYGNTIVENVASCAHVESHVSHTSVLCKHPTGLPRGVVMGRDTVRREILAATATVNAMRWPYSTLNTLSFLIQDTILPRGKWIIMCLHIGRYDINSCIPFDVKDLHYLANSCGGPAVWCMETLLVAQIVGDENIVGVIV